MTAGLIRQRLKVSKQTAVLLAAAFRMGRRVALCREYACDRAVEQFTKQLADARAEFREQLADMRAELDQEIRCIKSRAGRGLRRANSPLCFRAVPPGGRQRRQAANRALRKAHTS
jgi:hypothetical protein